MKYIYYVALSMIIILFSQVSFACKMTPMGGSANTLIALLNSISNDSTQQDRSILRIRLINNASAPWTYVVETTKNGSDCQAVGYSANIEVTCEIKVQRLSKQFVCNSQ